MAEAETPGKAISAERVKELYRTVTYPGSFGGVNKFLHSLQKDGHRVDKEQVQKWLQEDDLYQLHKLSCKNFPRRPFMVQGIDQLWQADLSDISSIKQYNKGYHFLLFVIDTFSKYAWVKPIEDKGAKTLTNAVEEILASSQR